jgi:hypothetical protein
MVKELDATMCLICNKARIKALEIQDMKLAKSVRYSFGRKMLRKEIDAMRLRKGYNFNSAQSIGILYKDSDESFYKAIKEYATFLKTSFEVKTVKALGYIDELPKKIPTYQQHALEFEYFSKEDVNWFGKPVQGIESFINEDFHILLDFSGGSELPLNYVLKESRACMKVGVKGTMGERYCDLIIDMGQVTGIDKFVAQLNQYLSNSKIR